MPRILHIADTHVGGLRIQEQAAILDRVVEMAAALQVDLWIHAGDLYGRHVPHIPSPRERQVLETRFRRLSEIAPGVVLLGNHDHEVATELHTEVASTFPIYVCTGIGEYEVFARDGSVIDVYAMAYVTKSWALEDPSRRLGVFETTEAMSQAVGMLLDSWGRKIDRRRAGDGTRYAVLAAHANVRGSTLSGGEVMSNLEIEIPPQALVDLGADYAALGHIHRRQEPVARAWFPGSPWPTDFGESDECYVHVVDLGSPTLISVAGVEPEQLDLKSYDGSDGYAPMDVTGVPTNPRPLVRLEYRWDAEDDSAEPRWVKHPTPEQLARVPNAQVRARLRVPDTHSSSVPWEAALQALVDMGAWKLQPEKTIEPVLRVRAPKMADATTALERAEAAWEIRAEPPSGASADLARRCIALLEDHDDDAVRAEFADLLDDDHGTTTTPEEG